MRYSYHCCYHVHFYDCDCYIAWFPVVVVGAVVVVVVVFRFVLKGRLRLFRRGEPQLSCKEVCVGNMKNYNILLVWNCAQRTTTFLGVSSGSFFWMAENESIASIFRIHGIQR